MRRLLIAVALPLLSIALFGCSELPHCPPGQICNFDGLDMSLATGQGRLRMLFAHSAGDYPGAKSLPRSLATELGLVPMGEVREVPLTAIAGDKAIDQSVSLNVSEYGDGKYVRLEVFELALSPHLWQEKPLRQWPDPQDNDDNWRPGKLLKAWATYRSCRIKSPVRKLTAEAVCKWINGSTRSGSCALLPRVPNGDRLAIVAHGMGAMAVYSVLQEYSGTTNPLNESLRRVIYVAPPFEATFTSTPEQCEAPKPYYGSGFTAQGVPVVIRDPMDALASPLQSGMAVDVTVNVGGGNPGYFDSPEIIDLLAHGRARQ